MSAVTPAATPKPGIERPTWLLEQINSRRKASMHTLYSPGNLGLLADWIAQLEQEAAAAPDIAAERINTLTRELAETRAENDRLARAWHAKQESATAADGEAAIWFERVQEAQAEVERLRALLAEYGWVYFRVEDPANPLHRSEPLPVRRGRHRPAKLPPGKYVQMCRVCGALRSDGHLPECVIGRALAP